jgi:hypothetical protein
VVLSRVSCLAIGHNSENTMSLETQKSRLAPAEDSHVVRVKGEGGIVKCHTG